MDKRLYIVMYHYTRDLIHSRYPKIHGLDVDLFRKQIAYLNEKFNIVTMEQTIEAVNGGKELPDNPVLLTFDDGYADNYTYAFPILEEYGLQGSFFIPGKTFSTHQLLDVNKLHYIVASADINMLIKDVFERMDYYRGADYDYPSNEELFAEYGKDGQYDGKEIMFIKRMLQTYLPEELRNRISSDLFEKYVDVPEEVLSYELYMSRDQVRTLKRHGMFIGVHGYDHYWLGELPTDKMKEDVNSALKVMSEFIEDDKWVMCYPKGNYSDALIDHIKEKGAVVGLACEERIAHIGVDSPMVLPRMDCNNFPPKSEKYKEM